MTKIQALGKTLPLVYEGDNVVEFVFLDKSKHSYACPKFSIPTESRLTQEEFNKLSSREKYAALTKRAIPEISLLKKRDKTFVENDEIIAFYHKEWSYNIYSLKRQIVMKSKNIASIVYDKKTKKIRTYDPDSLCKFVLDKYLGSNFYDMFVWQTSFRKFSTSKVFLKNLFAGKISTMNDVLTLFKKHSLQMPTIENRLLFEIFITMPIRMPKEYTYNAPSFVYALKGMDTAFLKGKNYGEIESHMEKLLLEGDISDVQDLLTSMTHSFEGKKIILSKTQPIDRRGTPLTILGGLCTKIGYKIDEKTTFKNIYNHAREWAKKNSDFPCEI
jgi:hypothetical protein